ncbi:MAG: SPASM domain-containing protein, partial [Acidobacteriota bacterium]
DQVATERALTFRSEMTTNGYLLTPDVAERLLRWRIRGFQITLDGPAAQHDRSRPTRDGRPTFETIVENLVALSRRDESFYVTIRNNFDQTNHDAVPELIETLEERLGGDSRFRLAFQAVGRWGGQNDEQLAVCNDDQSELVTARLHDEARRRGFEVPTLREVAHVGGQACYAARPYNLIVGAHGQLMKCTVILDSEDYNVVGQLGPDGEVQLDEERFALWTEPAFEQDTQCQKCVVVPLCQGIHCPKVRFEHDRSPCCSTRSRAKKELLDLVSVSKHRERKRSVALEA